MLLQGDIDRSKPFRVNDLFHPESASSYRPGVQKKPSSRRGEAGKPISKGQRLKKIEVGPPAAKRHVGKQKPKVANDFQGGSSRKKVVVSYPQQQEDGEDICLSIDQSIYLSIYLSIYPSIYLAIYLSHLSI